MKVLLLHQHFKTPYTGGAIRSYYLAKALVDHGIHTVIFTGYGGNRYKVEDVDGIEVHYLPVGYENSYGFYRRSFAFIRYVWKACLLSGKFRDVDLCYAISVPLTVGIAAVIIKTRFHIPFIFEVGDLWPDAPVQMGFVRNRLLQKALYSLEKKIYNAAHSIVALSPSIQLAIEKKTSGKKIHLIPNMADTDFFSPGEKDHTLQAKFNVENKFVVSYIGAIGVANGLEHFVRCAKACEDYGLSVHFILCGEGGVLASLEKQVNALQLKNFSILPFQNREGVRDIMNVTDAVFISYIPVPILETGSPNKYFDGLAAGKLIIINFGGWIREETANENCGIFVHAQNPEDFPNKIQAFISNISLLSTHQKNSRLLAEKKYARRMLSKTFAEVIAERVV